MTPGSTEPVVSRTTPAMPACADANAGIARKNAVANSSVEVFLRDGELILAGRQQRKAIGPVFAGIGGGDDAGFDVFDFHFAAGHDCAVRIGDFTGE